MASKDDSFSAFDDVLAKAATNTPWVHRTAGVPLYVPDYRLLEQLLSIPTADGAVVESGRFANGVDSWIAHELRRAGFETDEVWPRPTRPRILPRDVAVLLSRLPTPLAVQVRERLMTMPSVAPGDARVLGRAYDKQVDVAIARWDRGPELLVSTKTMVKAFGKNLGNRFEEAYGDAGNLRSRYPLAAVGYFFVQRSTILQSEPGAFERTKDMMRKLRELDGTNGYTATGLALVSWDDDDPTAGVTVELDAVPDDIGPAQFFARMIERVVEVTPVVHHVEVRSRLEGREVPVELTDVAEAIVADEEVDAETLGS
jgi:hypothetical protein